MTEIEILDPLAYTDLERFTTLAHRLDDEGAMRLHVAGTVLAVTVAPLYPHGIGDRTPLVLAMRMCRIADAGLDGFDALVPLTNLKDRFAREENGTALPVPPNHTLAAWAGIAPPRGPWEQTDSISAQALREAAADGIDSVKNGTPEVAGSHAVSALRARVWSRGIGMGSGATIPSGLAFAASGLNFIPPTDGDPIAIMSAPGWLRLVTPGGHLLTRDLSAN